MVRSLLWEVGTGCVVDVVAGCVLQMCFSVMFQCVCYMVLHCNVFSRSVDFVAKTCKNSPL